MAASTKLTVGILAATVVSGVSSGAHARDFFSALFGGFGLAPVTIEKDQTLRKGDIVAGAGGLMVTERSYDKRGAALNMTPAPDSIRSKFQRLPVMASD